MTSPTQSSGSAASAAASASAAATTAGRPRPAPRHVPIETDELVGALAPELGERSADFLRLARLLDAWMGYEVRQRLVELRAAYVPFAPDLEHPRSAAADEDRDALRRTLHAGTAQLLTDANFEELDRAYIEDNLEHSSPDSLAVRVDFDDYVELSVWVRGRSTRTVRRRDWRGLWLRHEEVEVEVFRRLFLAVELVELEERAQQIAERDKIKIERARKRVRRTRARLGDRVDAQHMCLKLFRDVPAMDLETLLPNTQICMRGFDKLKLGITGGGGTLGGLFGTLTKLGAAASPMTWALGLVGLVGVLWRQVAKVFSQRTKYLADLASCLYFLNLDNGWGAISNVARMAVEEESREALLAYALLARAGAAGLEREGLDTAVEEWLRQRYGLERDFEVEDGLRKLADLGLARESGGVWHALPPDEAFGVLDQRWDAAFAAPAEA